MGIPGSSNQMGIRGLGWGLGLRQGWLRSSAMDGVVTILRDICLRDTDRLE